MNDLEWNALEHAHQERTREWYYALGTLTVSSALIAIVFGNSFFAVLIMLAGFTLGLLAARPPRLISFSLNERGLMVDEEWYPMDTLRAFWITEDDEGATLLIDTPRIMTPDLVIPLAGVHPEQVRHILSAHVEEKELHEPLAIKILEIVGL